MCESFTEGPYIEYIWFECYQDIVYWHIYIMNVITMENSREIGVFPEHVRRYRDCYITCEETETNNYIPVVEGMNASAQILCVHRGDYNNQYQMTRVSTWGKIKSLYNPEHYEETPEGCLCFYGTGVCCR